MSIRRNNWAQTSSLCPPEEDNASCISSRGTNTGSCKGNSLRNRKALELHSSCIFRFRILSLGDHSFFVTV